MTPDLTPSSFILYTTPNGEVKFDVFVKDETVWLTQKQMAQLFDIDRTGITKHVNNVYESAELEPQTTSAKIAQVAEDGKKREIDFYNLDMIIAVGYRVNSKRATQFRIWATQVLREYIIKGFAMNDERLKNPNTVFGKDYFEEQLARIRNIRSSERRFYAETQSQRGVVMYMKDWVEKLNSFLQFNEKEILQDSGRISHEVAIALAEGEFEKYQMIQDRLFESDFDREVKKLERKGA